MKAERDEEAAEKSLKLADVSLWGLRKKAFSKAWKLWEAASADVEAAASFPEDLATCWRWLH